MSVNEFLDVLLGDPAAAPSLVWLPLIHRIAAAENGKNVILGGFKRRNYRSFNCLQSFIQWNAFLVDAPVSAVYDISVPNVLRPGATNVKNVFGVDFLFLSHITPITRSASITHRYVERDIR